MNQFNQILCVALLYAIVITYSPSGVAGMGNGGRTIFEGLPTEDQCRNCHDDLARFPQLAHVNADRHHRLVGSPVPQLGDSKAPNTPGGTPGDPYECTACHEFVWDTTQMMYVIKSFTDCLQCHPVSVVTGTPGMGTNVHHWTETFHLRECYSCHNNQMGMGWRGRWARLSDRERWKRWKKWNR